MAEITFKGDPVHTSGTLPALNTPAPSFSLTNGELNDVGLEAFAGKTLVLNIVPSLDTSVCIASARRFNEALSDLEGVAVANVSADLPFAQGRNCSSEGLERIENLSSFRNPEFGTAYGVTITDSPLKGLLSRAIVVINQAGNVVYTEQIPEIAQEPDYAAALDAVQSA